MAYLGRQPIIGNYQVLDAITATTTDTYALTKNSVAVFPQTPANCIVSLNGVIQAPFDSYTISGSNIVFASALTGSDSIDFITVLGDVLNVGTVSDGTITTDKLADSSVSLAKLTATGTKDATTFLRGDNTFASAGGANTPAFLAKPTTTQSITANTWTKVNFGTEILDTNSNFASSRFTPTTAGYYFIYTALDNGNTNTYFYLNIYKNGSSFVGVTVDNSQGGGASGETIMYFNGSTDYVEVYTYQGGGAGTISANTQGSTFGGFKIIE